MKRVTKAELAAILFGIQGSTFIGMRVRTDPKMRKTGNPYHDRVVKVNQVNGLVNFHYDEGVLRRLAKEGKSPDDFRQGSSWHEPVLTEDGKLTPLCRHKTNGTEYLRFQVTKTGTPIYLDTKTGQEVPATVLQPFLAAPRKYENQGLDEPLIFATYGLDSIERISIKGEDMEIIG